MLDPFFCNVKQSCRSKELPQLMNCDHNMISMVSIYKSELKQLKPKVITKTSMTPLTEDTMNACFQLTDWDMFVEACEGDVNIHTDTVTSYIMFCYDMHAEKKQITIFPNSKPWVTPVWRLALQLPHINPEYARNCVSHSLQLWIPDSQTEDNMLGPAWKPQKFDQLTVDHLKEACCLRSCLCSTSMT